MYIRVRVTPGAKKESVRKVREGEYEMAVKEKAERNMANRRVIELAAREFRLPARAVRIVNGHRSPSKLLRLETGRGSKQL